MERSPKNREQRRPTRRTSTRIQLVIRSLLLLEPPFLLCPHGSLAMIAQCWGKVVMTTQPDTMTRGQGYGFGAFLFFVPAESYSHVVCILRLYGLSRICNEETCTVQRVHGKCQSSSADCRRLRESIVRRDMSWFERLEGRNNSVLLWTSFLGDS